MTSPTISRLAIHRDIKDYVRIYRVVRRLVDNGHQPAKQMYMKLKRRLPRSGSYKKHCCRSDYCLLLFL